MVEVTDMLTAGEAAEELGYHLNHLYRLLKSGDVKGQKWAGRIWMIERREVERVKALQDGNGRLQKGQRLADLERTMTTRLCPVIEMKDNLLSRLEVYELPSDFRPSTHKLFNLQVQLRHRYTNYEELLGYEGLEGLCIEHIENGGECTYSVDENDDPRWIGCPALSEIYNALKWTATDKALEAYERWTQREE